MTTEEVGRKIDAAVVAAPPTRRYRAAAFQAYVLAASLLFLGLAVAAHFIPYFPVDLKLTHAIQSQQGAAFRAVMVAMSWFGFAPQCFMLGGLSLALLFFLGLKWEAIAALIAASGGLLGMLIKVIVYRPRPSADLVQVFEELPTASFPSGHVLMATTLAGFLGFLAFTLLKRSGGRTALLVVLALFITLMGPSRIYLGQHWFSDTVGAYLLGSLWLALAIRIYRWGKSRFFVDQPVAPPVETGRAAEADR